MAPVSPPPALCAGGGGGAVLRRQQTNFTIEVAKEDVAEESTRYASLIVHPKNSLSVKHRMDVEMTVR